MSQTIFIQNIDILKKHYNEIATKTQQIPTCASCGFAENRDLLNGQVPCGYRWCLAKDRWTRTRSLVCAIFFDLKV